MFIEHGKSQESQRLSYAALAKLGQVKGMHKEGCLLLHSQSKVSCVSPEDANEMTQPHASWPTMV